MSSQICSEWLSWNTRSWHGPASAWRALTPDAPDAPVLNSHGCNLTITHPLRSRAILLLGQVSRRRTTMTVVCNQCAVLTAFRWDVPPCEHCASEAASAEALDAECLALIAFGFEDAACGRCRGDVSDNRPLAA